MAGARFLTDEELTCLTGKRTRPARIRSLERRKIAYSVNDLGQVVVLWAAVELHMGLAPAGAPQAAVTEPDFSVFEGV